MSREVSSGAVSGKIRWSNLMHLFIFLVVVAEIIFLGRLDLAKNAAMVQLWTNTFYYPSSSSSSSSSSVGGKSVEFDASGRDGKWVEVGDCEEWLEREDAVSYSRDFRKDPVFVAGADQVGFPFWVFFFFYF